MKTKFDTADLLNEIEIRFGKTVTPSKIKKNYCCERSIFRTAADLFYGDTNDFDIVKIKSGKIPFVIFINGFLTADQKDNNHWKSQLELLYPENAWFHLRWNSKQLMELGTYIGGIAGKVSISLLTASVEKKLMKTLLQEVAVPIAPVVVAAHDLVRNPWHQALYRAEQTGKLLAEYLYRNSSRSHILMGHSLGARVIFYTLYILASKKHKSIVKVICKN